jgi:extradiol dioxygenase family protein
MSVNETVGASGSTDGVRSTQGNTDIWRIRIEVRDIEETRRFYVHELGCSESHSQDGSVVFGLAGKQIHCRPSSRLGKNQRVTQHYSLINGTYRLAPHVCVELALKEWESLAGGLRRRRFADATQYMERPVGGIGYAVLTVIDPSGHLIEFRSACHARDEQKRKNRGVALWAIGCVGLASLCWWMWQAESSRPLREDASIPSRLFQ